MLILLILLNNLNFSFFFQINLNDIDVFETLAIAYELGIDDLQEPCREHITATLCIRNACTYLISSLNLEARIPDKAKNFLVDKITCYVGENATDCVQTASFLKLPKNALTHLVSSDYVRNMIVNFWPF